MTDGTTETRGSTPERPQEGHGAQIPQTQAQPASGQGTPLPPPRPARSIATTLFNGVANIIGVAAIIFFTYYFTTLFSKKPPAPAPVPESVQAAAKKVEELRAQERRLLTTYGISSSALKTVRIPIDRAMELTAAESSQPPVAAALAPKLEAPAPNTATTATATPKVEQPAVAPTPPAVASAATPSAMPPSTATPAPPPAPAPAPTPVGLAPEVMYRAVCIACHDVDGRGGIVRKAMPAIPDLTDPKWHLSKTDAELQHSILEGKGQLMLPMKDKFALARTDPKAMVAFVRRFQPGAPAIAAGSPPPPATVATAVASSPPPAAATAPMSNVPPSPATTPTAAPVPAQGPSAPGPAPAAVATGSSASALALSAPLPPEALALLSPPAPVTTTPSHTSSRRGPAPSPEAAARVRVAAGVYQIYCVACHGPDGRGSLVRVAMPVIPDFTTRAWQSSRESAQLSVSILEGKGTLMPPWHGKVSPEQARDLVAYVRNFGPADLLAAQAPLSEFGQRNRNLKKQWDELDQQSRSLSRP
ncbi:MAG TPA: c-type cytochrome [Isosphaeraceae bacterium]|nr:c-type cytochrome [Isosphaeraceae bacterium]